MKANLIILVSLFFSCSCNCKTEHKTKVISFNENKFNKSIIGSWQLCKTIENNIETSYNVCPTIIFTEDGSGYVKYSEERKSAFTYLLKNDIIIFSFKSLNDKKMFFSSGTEFNFEFYINSEIETLELLQIKSDNKFILSRVIS